MKKQQKKKDNSIGKNKPKNGKGKVRKKPSSLWLDVLPDDRWIRVKRGVTIWEALRKTDIDLEGECGGLGKCGKCKIRVVTPVGPPDKDELEHLSKEELEKGVRLACRIKIRKSLVIYRDIEDEEFEFFQILKHGSSPQVDIDPLLDRRLVRPPAPSLEDQVSDITRLKRALGPQYEHLKIAHSCLTSLYRNLRRADFSCLALLYHDRLLALDRADSNRGIYGIAFDLGTTTLVGKLIDLRDGNEKAVISRLNSQSKFGTNVISRIQYAAESRNNLTRMQMLMVNDLNIIIKALLNAQSLKGNQILIAAAAGNTTMQHFLLGVDPSGIAEAPFSPVLTETTAYKAAELGLWLHPDARVQIMPSRSGYIGGDLIGFILSSKAAEQKDQLVLGLDFGTNGEIFLGNRKRMLTCSAAAGPALEGAKISHGMIAKAGAIESFRVEEDGGLGYRVIGNILPKGLCGSGLVDLAAVLLHCGLIDAEGLLGPHNLKASCDPMAARLVENPETGVYAFCLADAGESGLNKDIFLTQKDVRELQLAKGAISAGVKVLLAEMGATMDDVDVIYLAGALGNYVHPCSAIRTGLIPWTFPEKIVSLGNAASTGAQMVLLSKEYMQRAEGMARFIEHVELSGHPAFFDHFVEEMNFPSENIWPRD